MQWLRHRIILKRCRFFDQMPWFFRVAQVKLVLRWKLLGRTSANYWATKGWPAYTWSCYFLDMLMHRRLAALFHVILSVPCTSAPFAKQVTLRAECVHLPPVHATSGISLPQCHRCAFPNLCPQKRSGAVWRNFATCFGSLQPVFFALLTWCWNQTKWYMTEIRGYGK